MELMLAKKILELDDMELMKVLEEFKREDKDSYEILKELVEDI
jgi:hypothetical protein